MVRCMLLVALVCLVFAQSANAQCANGRCERPSVMMTYPNTVPMGGQVYQPYRYPVMHNFRIFQGTQYPIYGQPTYSYGSTTLNGGCANGRCGGIVIRRR